MCRSLYDHAPCRCAPPALQKVREVVQELLDKGEEPNSQSQYVSPAFLMPKPNGKYRLVIDYGLLNRKLVLDGFATPFRVFVLELHRGRVFFVVDFSTTYYQIPLSASSRNITSYSTPFGLWLCYITCGYLYLLPPLCVRCYESSHTTMFRLYGRFGGTL
jgi:hypothetical protein